MVITICAKFHHSKMNSNKVKEGVGIPPPPPSAGYETLKKPGQDRVSSENEIVDWLLNNKSNSN